MMNRSHPSLDVERWQPVQDALAEVLGLNIGLMDSQGRPLTRSINVLKTPWSVLTNSPKGFSRYAECLRALLTEAQTRSRPLVCQQVAGLNLCTIPIERGGSPVAYFVMGPCLVGRRGQPDDYIGLAKEFDIRIDQWMEALQEIRVFSFVGLNAVASLLGRLGEWAFPTTEKPAEELQESRRAKREAILERLLDTAIRTVDAEAGSILVVGEGSDELVIQVARGLKEEIVRDTRIRFGEGVAGLVAAERSPLRISREAGVIPRLEGKLRRPDLQDAMVIPMVRGSSVLGVLCVSSSLAGRRLREDGGELLQRLTSLVEEVLS